LPDGSFVQTFTDISKRVEAEAGIARMAAEDPLTGLPNRRVFRATLDAMSRDSAASEIGAEFSVLFLDLDRFKVVNDTLGHRVGDVLLQEVATRLRGALTQSDVLARLGGDEFAIVVTSARSREAVGDLARYLTDLISQPYEIDGRRILSSVSIGIAVGRVDGNTADELLMAADLALYAVKAVARGGFRFYQKAMNEEINVRREIEMDLREAIEKNELELEYQPIIELRTNRITGFEALARWRHQRNGASGDIHPGGRGQRAHPSARHVGSGAGLPKRRELADRPQSVGEPIPGAVFKSASLRRDQGDPIANRPGAASA
jgi:diguanylate cyclase (GGDEF)-like protein